jgi:HK97 family phage prohead protease
VRIKNYPFEFAKATKQPEVNTTAFEGYASTWEKDLGGDTIMPGAFTDTIKERLGKNLIKVRWMHYEPFGRCTEAHEDSKGLYVRGIVSNTPTNMERIALMEDKTVDRLSIGYDIPSEDDYDWNDDGSWWGARDIHKVDLYEWSPVDLAMNEGTSVQLAKSLMAMGFQLPDSVMKSVADTIKAATSYSNLPLAERNHTWDSSAAEKRVRNWADANDTPNAKYRKMFFWYDSENADNFGAYKLGFADIINGSLTAVPKGVFAAAAAIQGARGGVDIPEADVSAVKSHIEKYYAKMRQEFDDDTIIAPWNQEGKSIETDSKVSIHIHIEGKEISDIEQKIGAELSKKNRNFLEIARDNIDKVLKDTASDETEEEPKDAKMNWWENPEFVEILDSLPEMAKFGNDD